MKRKVILAQYNGQWIVLGNTAKAAIELRDYDGVVDGNDVDVNPDRYGQDSDGEFFERIKLT